MASHSPSGYSSTELIRDSNNQSEWKLRGHREGSDSVPGFNEESDEPGEYEPVKRDVRITCESRSQCAHRCLLKIKRRNSHLTQSHTFFHSTYISSTSYHQSRHPPYLDSTPFYTYHLVYQVLTTMKTFFLLFVACTLACARAAPFLKKTFKNPLAMPSDGKSTNHAQEAANSVAEAYPDRTTNYAYGQQDVVTGGEVSTWHNPCCMSLSCQQAFAEQRSYPLTYPPSYPQRTDYSTDHTDPIAAQQPVNVPVNRPSSKNRGVFAQKHREALGIAEPPKK